MLDHDPKSFGRIDVDLRDVHRLRTVVSLTDVSRHCHAVTCIAVDATTNETTSGEMSTGVFTSSARRVSTWLTPTFIHLPVLYVRGRTSGETLNEPRVTSSTTE